MLVPDDFTLTPVDGDFARDLPARWCFGGERAFGGYTAAIALGALLTASPHPVAASLAITFLEAGVPGPMTVSVEPLRSGRTAQVARATIRQGERPILLATAWLADGWTTPPVVSADDPIDIPDPDAAVPLTWLTDEWPVLRYGERAAVDYPGSWADFARGRPATSLWARVVPPEGHAGDPVPFAQMGDVLHLDAHLFDAPGQVTGFAENDLLSLDLTIAWRPGAQLVPSTAWRFLTCRGSVADGGVTATGVVHGPDRAVLAHATSQGLLRRTPTPH